MCHRQIVYSARLYFAPTSIVFPNSIWNELIYKLRCYISTLYIEDNLFAFIYGSQESGTFNIVFVFFLLNSEMSSSIRNKFLHLTKFRLTPNALGPLFIGDTQRVMFVGLACLHAPSSTRGRAGRSALRYTRAFTPAQLPATPKHLMTSIIISIWHSPTLSKWRTMGRLIHTKVNRNHNCVHQLHCLLSHARLTL